MAEIFVEAFTGWANRLTLLRMPCCIALLFGLLNLAEGYYALAAISFTVACVLDKLDGEVARWIGPTSLGPVPVPS